MTLPPGGHMQRTAIYDPVKRVPGRGPVASRPDRPRPTMNAVSSPMTRLFPTFTVASALFDVIAVPTGTANPANGDSPMFLLRRIRFDRDMAEVTLVGVA